MRLRHQKNACIILEHSSFVLKEPEKWKGKFKSLFLNDHPLFLEIGCGKGSFLIQMALLHPNINYIGIEKYDSVLVKSISKIENKPLKNLYFIWMDAFSLATIFDHEIDGIYLNFSDPWPKLRHHKRRLTSPSFLKMYKQISKKNSFIEMRTDNSDLFTYSLVQLSKYAYIFEEISLNWKKSLVQTEYEQKFLSLGYPIYYLRALNCQIIQKK